MYFHYPEDFGERGKTVSSSGHLDWLWPGRREYRLWDHQCLQSR